MKMRSTKGALLMSALSLFLCFTMLMGTTFAWFTDSAASNGNIITAGTLDVEMYWADGTEAVPTTDSGWIDASTGAIFKYTLWEPGYAEVRHIKIANEGNLALKYKVLIQANGTVSDLSDVIDVYYADPAVQVADASALTADNKLGTLTDVLANLGLTGNGTLEAGKSDIITLALKMQEGAGNEYMGKSIGTDFSIILVATQLTSEDDSFDNQYDAPAVYPTITTVTVPASGTKVSLSNEGVKLTVPAAATTEGDVFEIAVSNNNVTTDTATGETTVSFDLSLYKNSEPIAAGDTIYEIEMLVGNVYPTSVTHNGNELTKADTGADQTYKLEDGVLTIYTKSFSPFTFSYITGQLIADKAGEQAYALTIDELRTAVNAGNDFAGWTITMMEDIDLAGAEFAPIGYAVEYKGALDGAAPFSGLFDGNGHTISNYKVTEGVTVDGDPWMSLFCFIYAKGGFTAGVKNLTISNAMYNNPNGTVGVIANIAHSDGASPLEFSGLDISGTINAFGYYGQAGLVTLFYGNEALIEDVTLDVDFIIPADFSVAGYKFISPCIGQLHMLENGRITIEDVDYSGCSIYYPSTFRLEDRSTVIAGYNSIWVYDTPTGLRVLGCGGYSGQFYDDGITVTIDGVDYTYADLMKGQKDFPGYMYDYIIRPTSFIPYNGAAPVAMLNGVAYGSVQAAVNAAVDGDVVTVLGGAHNVFCPVGATDNATGRAHNLFIGKNITIVGEEGKEVILYSYQETYTSTFDARITVLVSGTNGVVIDNLTILPAYYPAEISTSLSTVSGSVVNSAVGADTLKFYYNQIIDTMRSYNGSARTSESTIKNLTVQNCTIGDVAIPAAEWGSAIYFPGAVGNATNFAGLNGGYVIKNNILYGSICLCEGAAKDATAEECVIEGNTLYGGLILNGKRPTGWNYVSLTVFPVVKDNTFEATVATTDGHAWFIASRDGDASALVPEAVLSAYLADNTFKAEGGAELVIGSYAYSETATEYYAMISAK